MRVAIYTLIIMTLSSPAHSVRDVSEADSGVHAQLGLHTDLAIQEKGTELSSAMQAQWCSLPSTWPSKTLKGWTCVRKFEHGLQSSWIYLASKGAKGNRCGGAASTDEVVVKKFPKKADAALEKDALEALSAVRAVKDQIPKYYCAGETFVAMGLVRGDTVNSISQSISSDVLERQYCKLFTSFWFAGWAHGDINGENELWDGTKLNIIDFGFAANRKKNSKKFSEMVARDTYHIARTVKKPFEGFDGLKTLIKRVQKAGNAAEEACKALCEVNVCMADRGKCPPCSR